MIEIKKYTTEYPLQMIGELSGICFGAKTAFCVAANKTKAGEIVDEIKKNSEEESDEDSEEFYELLYQFSQCKLTDIFVKEDLFSKNKENNVYLIADMNHID